MNNNEKKNISNGTFLLVGLFIAILSLIEIFNHDSYLSFVGIPFAEYPLFVFGIICVIVAIYGLVNDGKHKKKGK